MSEKAQIKVIAIDVSDKRWLAPWMGFSYVEGMVDGIAQHACSSAGYVRHDMGVTSDWKHEIYDELFPDGWEIEYCGEMGYDDAIAHLESVGVIKAEEDGGEDEC